MTSFSINFPIMYQRPCKRLDKSYLSGRPQCVTYNKNLSSPAAITCGVPQGSILGPFLFLLYIRSSYLALCSKTPRLIVFVDITNILFSHSDPEILKSLFLRFLLYLIFTYTNIQSPKFYKRL